MDWPVRRWCDGARQSAECLGSATAAAVSKKEPTMTTMTDVDKVLYTAKVHTTGGRDGGASFSDDRRLDIRHTVPGSKGTGTNPEQLFAAGWSACFEGAMGIAARKMKITLPPDMAIDAEVDLCLNDAGYFLQARLNISLPGLPRDVAQALADAAHETCPYSKATRGNIAVVINLV
jgi:osmotically inducible protein OsmC